MSRNKVLGAFKELHRITQKTFDGDKRALAEARNKINDGFRQEITEEEIPEKLKLAKDVGEILKRQVVQAVKNPESDNFKLNLRKETTKLDNTIFKEDAIMPPPRSKKCKPDNT